MSSVGSVGMGQVVSSFGSSYPGVNSGASIYAAMMTQFGQGSYSMAPGYMPEMGVPGLPQQMQQYQNYFNAHPAAAQAQTAILANNPQFLAEVQKFPEKMMKLYQEHPELFHKAPTKAQADALGEVAQGAAQNVQNNPNGHSTILSGAQKFLKAGGSKEILKGFGQAVTKEIGKGKLFGKFLQKLPIIGAVVSAVNVVSVYTRKNPPASKAEKVAAWVGLGAGIAANIPGLGTGVSTALGIASTAIGAGGMVVGAVKKAQFNKAQEAQEQAIVTNNYKATVGDPGAIAGGGVDERLANGIQPSDDVQQQFDANMSQLRFGRGNA